MPLPAARHCTACGGGLLAAVPPGDDRERLVCAACATVHYENPKVIVGSVCLAGDGRVLLCRRAIEPRAGFWTVPAGYMELGETAEEGAAREAWEEARARIEIEGLIATYSIPRIAEVQLLYRARLLEPGAVEAGPESLEVRLVAWDEVPWDELAFPTVRWVLARARALGDARPPFAAASNPAPGGAD